MNKRLIHFAWLILLVPAVAYAQPGPGKDNRSHAGKKSGTNAKRRPHAKGPGNHSAPRSSPPGAHPGQPGQPGQLPAAHSGNRPPGPLPRINGKQPNNVNPNHGRDGHAQPPPNRRDGRDRAREIINARKDLEKARKKARDESRDDIRRRYGNAKDTASKDRLRGEMSKHAQRVARLARLREIAEKNGDTARLNRIDALTTKESQRHQRWLETHAPAQ